MFIAVVVTVIVVTNVAEPLNLGVSAGTTDGRYNFSGGTSPIALALAALIILLYVLLMYASPTSLGKPLPGVFRRFVAFWLDFLIATMAMARILGILPTLTEWRRIGSFEWSFERTTPAKGDWLVATVGVLFGAALLLVYYALPLMRRKPSPGSCIVGYQVIPDEDITLTLWAVLLRTLLGFIAAAAAYLAPFCSARPSEGEVLA